MWCVFFYWFGMFLKNSISLIYRLFKTIQNKGHLINVFSYVMCTLFL